ncbi:MAG: DUF3990 domain-containing protein [Solobacterium sp.]|nr:DUF3990 domain-containing protein [Solobacterium sp.]MCH4222713.1 DUF3990 domain-containing protein [Solobacterium sp.]MCH4265600.1 DUF3990 domain-containing protein [Solobacterium sp.]
MDNYKIDVDIETVKNLLGYSLEELAKITGISIATLNNSLRNAGNTSDETLNEFYDAVFEKKLRLNQIKEQLYREEYASQSHKVLFHGAKRPIEGKIDLKYSKGNNDFGRGFYCGESLEQSAMYVSNYSAPSLYIVDFDSSGLKSKTYHVDRNWMLTIAYYRGTLNDYNDAPIIQKMVRENRNIDYYIAPIADNRMFEIIDSFINGEITDIQCQHCLSATNLGNQYVFVSQNVVNHVSILEHCFLATEELRYYAKFREDSILVNRDKVKIARRQYRNQGKYIEDIINETD